MKIKEGFMLRQLGSRYVVVALGKASEEFKGMIHLNKAGAFLWEQLSQPGISEQSLAQAMTQRYNIDEETARKDAAEFISTLKNAGLLEE